MQAIVSIAQDMFFLIIIALFVALDRRVTREEQRGRTDRRDTERELDLLHAEQERLRVALDSQQLRLETMQITGDTRVGETDTEAARRFAEGFSGILGFGTTFGEESK
ncbi:MAG: hypothetical protein LBN30_06785 [Oscillospiraceae bacterium]|jgi:hypothetical protein|nr:hypothetical protein [Oscillospiraceae bacterium]